MIDVSHNRCVSNILHQVNFCINFFGIYYYLKIAQAMSIELSLNKHNAFNVRNWQDTFTKQGACDLKFIFITALSIIILFST